MAKIRDPLPFAEHFGIDPVKLERIGILNPVLNVDTKLFIDPVLLETSSNSQISTDATSTFRKYFEDIIKLLHASKQKGDVA